MWRVALNLSSLGVWIPTTTEGVCYLSLFRSLSRFSFSLQNWHHWYCQFKACLYSVYLNVMPADQGIPHQEFCLLWEVGCSNEEGLRQEKCWDLERKQWRQGWRPHVQLWVLVAITMVMTQVLVSTCPRSQPASLLETWYWVMNKSSFLFPSLCSPSLSSPRLISPPPLLFPYCSSPGTHELLKLTRHKSEGEMSVSCGLVLPETCKSC